MTREGLSRANQGFAKPQPFAVLNNGKSRLNKDLNFRSLLKRDDKQGFERPDQFGARGGRFYLLTGSKPVLRTNSATEGEVKKRTSCFAFSCSVEP